MEMSRSLPSWTEIKYDWLKELLQMTVRGQKLDPNRELTVTEEVILKWLLFTITDPKIIKLPKVSHLFIKSHFSLGRNWSYDFNFHLEFKETVG